MRGNEGTANSRMRFQSAPGREAGRCIQWAKYSPGQYRFNPRPAVRPGDARLRTMPGSGHRSFNPRPAVRPGDAFFSPFNQKWIAVSIRARP